MLTTYLGDSCYLDDSSISATPLPLRVSCSYQVRSLCLRCSKIALATSLAHTAPGLRGCVAQARAHGLSLGCGSSLFFSLPPLPSSLSFEVGQLSRQLTPQEAPYSETGPGGAPRGFLPPRLPGPFS
mgnify:CR=1 FL=1